jgi:hypothetical protein
MPRRLHRDGIRGERRAEWSDEPFVSQSVRGRPTLESDRLPSSAVGDI